MSGQLPPVAPILRRYSVILLCMYTYLSGIRPKRFHSQVELILHSTPQPPYAGIKVGKGDSAPTILHFAEVNKTLQLARKNILLYILF